MCFGPEAAEGIAVADRLNLVRFAADEIMRRGVFDAVDAEFQHSWTTRLGCRAHHVLR